MNGQKGTKWAGSKWPAISVLILSLTLTAIAWRLVSQQDRIHIEKATALAMSAVHVDLSADMESLIEDETNLSKIWQFEDPSHDKWDMLAAIYIERHSGCQALAWLTPDYQQRWVTGPKGQMTASSLNMAIVRPLLQRALHDRQATISKAFLGSNRRTAVVGRRSCFPRRFIAWICPGISSTSINLWKKC